MLILKSLPKPALASVFWPAAFSVHEAQHGAEESLLLPGLRVEQKVSASLSFVRRTGCGGRFHVAKWIPTKEAFAHLASFEGIKNQREWEVKGKGQVWEWVCQKPLWVNCFSL